MVAPTPWSEYNNTNCPISPHTGVGSPYQSHSHGYHHHGGNNVTSPTNSDNNYYSSPVISPGNWNVPSPASISSPLSSASWQSFDSSVQGGSPNSAPAKMSHSSGSSTKMNEPPTLPTELGDQGNQAKKMSDTERRKAMEKVNKRFISKSDLEKEREKEAIRRANALMTEATRAREAQKKKLMDTSKKPVGRVVIIPTGKEHLATSTWSKKKKNPDEAESCTDAEFDEYVDDFKCDLDREREKWAQRTALNMVQKAKNIV